MRFKAATVKVSLSIFKTTLGKSITNYISVVVLLDEGFVQGAYTKGASDCFFVECFKAVTPEHLQDKF